MPLVNNWRTIPNKKAGVFIIVLVAGLLGSFLSSDFGTTWDEFPRQNRGEAAFAHLSGASIEEGSLTHIASEKFTRLAITEDEKINMYGNLFDLSAVALQRILGGKYTREPHKFDTRHVLNIWFGLIGVLFAALAAARVFGTPAGYITLALFLCSPRYVGHMMNNPKDIPFASFYMMALYFLCYLESKPPFLRPFAATGVIVSTALAMNVRVGAFLLFGYAGLFLLVRVIQYCRSAGVQPRIIAFTGYGLLCGAALAMWLGSVFWPWAAQAPFQRPFVALSLMKDFPHISTELFMGAFHSSDNLPWSYTPVWLGITTPIVGLVGFLAFFFRRQFSLSAFLILFSIVFPLVLIVAMGSVLYGGERHFLFVYPPLLCLAAGGWIGLWNAWKSVKARVVLVLVFVLMAIPPLRFHLVNHPNQVTYFNPLVGGTAGAKGNFGMDYWGNCVKEAVRKINQMKPPGVVGVKGRFPLSIRSEVTRYPGLVFLNKDSRETYDVVYRVLLVKRMNEQRLAEDFPSFKKEDEVSADGVALCLVLVAR